MRCLKRFVAREIYNVITNPPTGLSIGPDIRTRRENAGITLTALAAALGIPPIRLSRFERQLDYSNNLARRANTWLTDYAA